MYDVIVIGAGVTGCSIARELARKERQILVLEVISVRERARRTVVLFMRDMMPCREV